MMAAAGRVIRRAWRRIILRTHYRCEQCGCTIRKSMKDEHDALERALLFERMRRANDGPPAA